MLFIDFRKAFDTVDAKLLLNKLFHYGFDNLSIKLLSDYFSNRAQVVRFNDVVSDKQYIYINLGVPQRSVFGQLLFLIFINDLAFIVELACKLFADDTTLYATTTNLTDSLENLIKYFIDRLKPLLESCSMNRMDINWSKIGTNDISVTTEFKLHGVLINNNLIFKQHVVNICKYVIYIDVLVPVFFVVLVPAFFVIFRFGIDLHELNSRPHTIFFRFR